MKPPSTETTNEKEVTSEVGDWKREDKDNLQMKMKMKIESVGTYEWDCLTGRGVQQYSGLRRMGAVASTL